MTTSCIILPPTFQYHVVHGHYPSVYVWYWTIGGICLLITAITIIPRLYAIQKASNALMHEQDKIVAPLSYKIIFLIVFYPLQVSLWYFLVLLVPIQIYTFSFTAHMYEGLMLYFFARLLIMYLGSFKALILAFKHSAPTKYWASPPFCCCFKYCLKAKTMTKNDFTIVYYLILQYSIMAPLNSFALLFHNFSNDTVAATIVGYVDKLCVMLCVYGLFALLNATKGILTQHVENFKVYGKFFAMKGAVLAVSLPDFLVTEISGIKNSSIAKGRDDSYYTDSVMQSALSSFMTVVMLTLLSFVFVKFYTIKDCYNAFQNHDKKSYMASQISRELLLINQTADDFSDKRHKQTAISVM